MIICGENNATGSYMTSLFLDFGDRYKNEDNKNYKVDSTPIKHASDEDDNINSALPVGSSPTTSLILRLHGTSTGPRSRLMMSNLITIMGKMASNINSPTHWIETLYAIIIEVEGFDEQVLLELFDCLQMW